MGKSGISVCFHAALQPAKRFSILVKPELDETDYQLRQAGIRLLQAINAFVKYEPVHSRASTPELPGLKNSTIDGRIDEIGTAPDDQWESKTWTMTSEG